MKQSILVYHIIIISLTIMFGYKLLTFTELWKYKMQLVVQSIRDWIIPLPTLQDESGDDSLEMSSGI